MTIDDSEKSVLMCSITRAISAYLHTLWGIDDQWAFRWIGANVQSHHSLHCESTNAIRYSWPVMVQTSLKVTREDSGVSVHTCSLTRVISTHLQTVRYRWPAKVEKSLCVNAVSPDNCSFTNCMRYMWPAKVQISLWICAVSPTVYRWTKKVLMNFNIYPDSSEPS